MILLVVFLLGLALTIVVLRWDIRTDFEKWRKVVEVEHRKEFWERYAFLLLPYLCFVSVLLVRMVENTSLSTSAIVTISLVSPAAAMGFVYMTLFDGYYNRRRGFDFWFNGSPNGKKDDSVFDRFWRKVSDRFEIFVKVGFSLLSVFLYLFFCFYNG